MGATVDAAAGYRLPAEFPDDPVTEKIDTAVSDSEFRFPAEFPYLVTESAEPFNQVQPQSTLPRLWLNDVVMRRPAESSGLLGPNLCLAPNPNHSVFRNVYVNPRLAVRRNPAGVGRSGGGPAERRECAGTGVFLPRRYDGYPAFIPQRIGFAPSQPQFNPGFFTEYDLVMARRNALLLQHRRSLLLEGSSSWECEWTY